MHNITQDRAISSLRNIDVYLRKFNKRLGLKARQKKSEIESLVRATLVFVLLHLNLHLQLQLHLFLLPLSELSSFISNISVQSQSMVDELASCFN